jgi:(p)ppGpp synthase/HD superfamily hydrolase
VKHSYAQTNIQLFDQLRRDGYAPNQIDEIFKAYELVMSLFAGSYRQSGKTFIAHLVGTASILSCLHVTPKLITAGLLHATYTHGDFGNGVKGISWWKREKLKKAAGQEVEELVARYSRLVWTTPGIQTLHAALHKMDSIEREVVLLRLTNELEDLLDLGLFYWSAPKSRLEYVERKGHLMVEIAAHLGYPRLAAELSDGLAQTRSAAITLDVQQWRNEVLVIFPPSYSERWSARWSRRIFLPVDLMRRGLGLLR